ncbi:MAG: DUF1343 domain-containing protein [Desulforhopalus sp.]|nr:DUF1343 domain-containing protein [Desulforhopalus sp.]
MPGRSNCKQIVYSGARYAGQGAAARFYSDLWGGRNLNRLQITTVRMRKAKDVFHMPERYMTRWKRIRSTVFTTAALLVIFLVYLTGQLHGMELSDARSELVPGTLQQLPLAATFELPVLAQMEQAIAKSMTSGSIPGGVLWLERNGIHFESTSGYRALDPRREVMTRETIFDIASLTKVVATTPAVMKLIEQGKIQLSDTAQKFISEFDGNGKENITIRQLLTHTSGLRPDINTRPAWSGYNTAIKMACAEKVFAKPGSDFRYSDINFFILSEVVRRVTGQGFDEFVQQQVYRPLKMKDTGFLPDPSTYRRIAPTDLQNGVMLRGTVHDPTARYMGGVAGHAGLFSTIDDLARYCRMLVNGGELDGIRVFNSDTVRLMSSVQSPSAVEERRGLGWEIDSGYSRPRGKYFPVGSYGHTGFTGTSLWIDPFSKTFWIFLSSRLHPNGRGNIHPLQAELANLAALAIKGFDFTNVQGALTPRDLSTTKPAIDKKEVLNGIDVLTKENFASLHGLKIGLITNHTGRSSDGSTTIDLLHKAANVDLVVLFSPEHGIRGTIDAYVDDGVDEITRLPIYSLYGKRRRPLPEQLEGLDALVFDIQDIGCRFYTYISTMGNCMEVAAKSGVTFIVLDRVNPITGSMVAGPVLDGATGFTGWHEIPVRHGMTVGELARLFNSEKNMGVHLDVVELSGWKRNMWLDETTIPWINTSPNMRSLTQATLYPGVGLLETTNLSVGRGTDTPFELFGAPYIDGKLLAKRMNSFGIRGVRFDPIEFTPDTSKFRNQKCEGVRIMLTNRNSCDVINIGIAGALALNDMYRDKFGLDRFRGLLKHDATMDAIRMGLPLNEIRKFWASGLSRYTSRRQQYQIYE